MKYVIVGGGVGGLSAGILLRRAGQECHIYERCAAPGGNLCGWRRGEYEVDNCIHWLCGTREGSAAYRAWEEVGMLGEGVEILRLPAFYSSSDGRDTVSLWRDPEAARREWTELSPRDRGAIDRLIDRVLWVRDCAESTGQNGARALLARGKWAAAIGSLSTLSLGEYAMRFSHPLLRRVITDRFTDRFIAAALPLSWGAFAAGDADIPAGGSRAAAERMSARFTSLGGVLHTDRQAVRSERGAFGVESITVASPGGEEETVRADRFLFMTDPGETFGKILPVAMPEALAKRYRSCTLPSAIRAAYAVDAAAVCHVGSLFVPSGYSEAGDLCPGRSEIRSYAYDPAFAPEGSAVVSVMRLLDSEASRAIIRKREENREGYDAFKANFAEKMQRDIVNFYPEAEKSIRLIDTHTPATFYRYFGGSAGSFMGFLHPKCTLPTKICARIPGLENARFGGQWRSVFGGLPNAAVRSLSELDL